MKNKNITKDFESFIEGVSKDVAMEIWYYIFML